MRERPQISSAPVRLGIVGLGARGSEYARGLLQNEVPGGVLAAVCDPDTRASAPFSARYPSFRDFEALVAAGGIDALVIATPHSLHAEAASAAIASGLSLLLEKPLAPRLGDARRLVAEHALAGRPGQLFATALVLRADPRYQRLKALLECGELGRVTRASFFVSDCLRSAAYYREASWRGSFALAGGGLLLNQCLHQLDLWQWLFGMPRRVQAFARFGRHHAIEVEDELTAYLEHEGMTGVFVASTGEAPGTHRLEVAAEHGKVVIEGGAFELWKNPCATAELIASLGARERAPEPAYERLELRPGGLRPAALLADFVRAARGEGALHSPASEGLPSIELANALLESSLDGCPVTLPLDDRGYAGALERVHRRRTQAG